MHGACKSSGQHFFLQVSDVFRFFGTRKDPRWWIWVRFPRTTSALSLLFDTCHTVGILTLLREPLPPRDGAAVKDMACRKEDAYMRRIFASNRCEDPRGCKRAPPPPHARSTVFFEAIVSGGFCGRLT